MAKDVFSNMNETRKKIIINEINFWKKSRILPDQYCDYLLAFYSEGENETSPAPKPFLKRIFSLTYIIITLIIVSALIVNYFTEINPAMQMAIQIIFIVALIFIVIHQNKKQEIISIPLVATAFVTLLMTVKAWEAFADKNDLILYLLLFANCAGWFIAGKKMKLLYFTIAGVLGSIVIIYFVGVYFGIFW